MQTHVTAASPEHVRVGGAVFWFAVIVVELGLRTSPPPPVSEKKEQSAPAPLYQYVCDPTPATYNELVNVTTGSSIIKSFQFG
jgi:hypothetical protein